MNIKEKIESALNGKKLSLIEDFDLKRDLVDFLIKAQENIGLNVNEGKTESMVQRICEYSKYYKYLTLEDLEVIFEAGSIGVWGETFRLNMQVINKWFSEYCKERSLVMQDLQKSDMCTTKERLDFLWVNREKMPFWKSRCELPRVARSRTGLKRINEI